MSKTGTYCRWAGVFYTAVGIALWRVNPDVGGVVLAAGIIALGGWAVEHLTE